MDLTQIIESTNLTPVIINEKSNFVIITYWWGRNNLNVNTQKPCRDELVQGQEPTKKPIKFELMIEQWKASCEKVQCNYLVQEYPEFAIPGGYQMAINAKPLFIKKALESVGNRAVVYIDGDMSVNKYPSIFDMKNIDFMARGWNIDPRGNMHYLSKMKPICFDPFTFETSGGTMYFGNTPDGHNLLKMWHHASSLKQNIGKADDRILSLLITSKQLYIKMNILQLPIEYLWLTDNYTPENKENQYLNRVHYDKDAIMFEHAACLTSEERAKKQGAAADRQPKLYDLLVENPINCQTEGGIFFKHIIFESEEQSLPWTKYLRYMSTAKLYKDADNEIIHPYYVLNYREFYGSATELVMLNIEKAKYFIDLIKGLSIKKNIVKIITENTFSYSNEVIYTPDVIATMLALHHLKISAIYLPSRFNFNMLKKVQTVVKHHNYELITCLKNDDENYPDFDKTSPIYLSCTSRILNHILKMSIDMNDFNKNVKLCALFVQLIRCSFITNLINTQSTTVIGKRSLTLRKSTITSQSRSIRSKAIKDDISRLSAKTKKTYNVDIEKRLYLPNY